MNVAPSSKIYGKIWVGFCLNSEKRFFLERFHFKGNRKSIGSSKNGTRDFQNNLPFDRLVCFYVTIK